MSAAVAKISSQKPMNIVALTGGVGGAKLALGLMELKKQQPEQFGSLSFIVNTADDFEHLGLHISPDLDTLMYTLSGQSNQKQGWGIEGETWEVKAALEAIGAPTWFQLGDKDIATHLTRTHLLKQGESLTKLTQKLFSQVGVDSVDVYPMCDEKVSTFVESDQGRLAFQDYFVAKQCEPKISAYEFEGIADASLSEGLEKALENADAVIFCPSNPFVSIEPVLSVPGLKPQLIKLKQQGKPVVAVSPIINGQAVKGPAAKMMAELNLLVNNQSVAEFYQDIVNHIIIDKSDVHETQMIEKLGLRVSIESTLMKTLDDKLALARSLMKVVQ